MYDGHHCLHPFCLRSISKKGILPRPDNYIILIIMIITKFNYASIIYRYNYQRRNCTTIAYIGRRLTAGERALHNAYILANTLGRGCANVFHFFLCMLCTFTRALIIIQYSILSLPSLINGRWWPALLLIG